MVEAGAAADASSLVSTAPDASVGATGADVDSAGLSGSDGLASCDPLFVSPEADSSVDESRELSESAPSSAVSEVVSASVELDVLG